ncbi:13014_t:CDS:2, partial [Dentiscutata heterogama]
VESSKTCVLVTELKSPRGNWRTRISGRKRRLNWLENSVNCPKNEFAHKTTVNCRARYLDILHST